MKQGKKQTVRCCLHGAAVLFLSAIAASCQDYTPYWGDNGSGNSGDASQYFSFNTTKEVTLNIDYGKKGSRALVDIFTENPAYIGADGEMHLKEEAEFKVFLDENGRFNGKVVLPADTKKVWVYTMRQNVPQLLMGETDSNGEVDIDGKEKVGDDNKDNPGYTKEEDRTSTPNGDTGYRDKDFEVIATSADEYVKGTDIPLKIWRAAVRSNGGAGFANHRKESTYSIVNWQGQRFGRIIPTHYYDTDGYRHNVVNTEGTYDTQGLIGEDANSKTTPMTQEDIDVIQHFLWNNNEIKPNGLNNRKYYDGLDTEDINTVIPHTFIEDGEVKTVEKAQVWLRFLGEGAYYNDGIGYYIYDTEDPPTSQGDIKAYYIAIPNTSSTAPYGNVTLYVTKPDGTVEEQQTSFKGRTIPFITYPNISYDQTDGVGVVNYNPIEPVYNETTKGYEYKIADKPVSQWTWRPEFVPFDTNQRIQLLYHDPVTNEVSRFFPPGKTIGFFLTYVINQDAQLRGYETFRISQHGNEAYFHSDWRLNDDQKHGETPYEYDEKGEGKLKGANEGTGIYQDQYGTSMVGTTTISKRHFIALNYKDYAIYGIEDGADNSMGDVLFAIETDPIGIVVNDDRVTIEPKMQATFTNHRTYAFEDIWPDGGDYDMNDVVIDHHHRMTIQRDGNGKTNDDWITRIEDDFTAIQPEGSADYQDAFGVEIPNRRIECRDSLHFYKDGAPYTPVSITENQNTTTIILFDNAKADDVRYNKFTIVRGFSKEYASNPDNNLIIETTQLEHTEDGVLKNALNPFIISQYDKNSGQGRYEIHLPKHKPTPEGFVLEDNTKNAAKYYVGKYEGKEYPFAISLPKSAFSYPWGRHFTDLSTGETIGIDTEAAYPDFSKWVEAKDDEERNKYSGWYRYFQCSIDDPKDTTTPDTAQ